MKYVWLMISIWLIGCTNTPTVLEKTSEKKVKSQKCKYKYKIGNKYQNRKKHSRCQRTCHYKKK